MALAIVMALPLAVLAAVHEGTAIDFDASPLMTFTGLAIGWQVLGSNFVGDHLRHRHGPRTAAATLRH